MVAQVGSVIGGRDAQRDGLVVLGDRVVVDGHHQVLGLGGGRAEGDRLGRDDKVAAASRALGGRALGGPDLHCEGGGGGREVVHGDGYRQHPAGDVLRHRCRVGLGARRVPAEGDLCFGGLIVGDGEGGGGMDAGAEADSRDGMAGRGEGHREGLVVLHQAVVVEGEGDKARAAGSGRDEVSAAPGRVVHAAAARRAVGPGQRN